MKLEYLPLFWAGKHEEAFKYLSESGVQAVEIGSGGYPGTAHADPMYYWQMKVRFRLYWMAKNITWRLTHSVVMAMPHPQKEIADKFPFGFEKLFCWQKNGRGKIITFSGCPGDGPNASYPNW